MKRLVRFMLVGGLCALVQFVVLQGLLHVGWHQAPANALGFLLSAQLNFVLSYLYTWHDADRKSGFELASKWLGFNLSVLLANGINTSAFLGLHHVGSSLYVPGNDYLSFIGAICISTGYTLVTNHFVLFRKTVLKESLA